MSRNWMPENHVAITDAGMVIEIEVGGVLKSSLNGTYERGQLCIRGQHQEFGQFECRFEIPVTDYSLLGAKATLDGRRLPLKAWTAFWSPGMKATFGSGHLRIEIPVRKNKTLFLNEPRAMMIYCNGCGKHFDIVVAAKGPEKYSCPACGKVQVFDLEALVNKALEQGKKMLGKKRGSR